MFDNCESVVEIVDPEIEMATMDIGHAGAAGNRRSMIGRLEEKANMEWNRSQAIALAADECTQCHGVGLITGRRGYTAPCNCVLRGVFRACYGKFIECVCSDKHVTRVRLEKSGGHNRRYSFGRKEEEYAADFVLVSRRHLDPLEFRVFRYHYLLGADWKLCSRRMHIDRGEFFHALYRVEQRLGRVFRELKPYPLFPLDEYFNSVGKVTPGEACSPGTADSANVVSIEAAGNARKQRKPVRPPLREVA